jgi:hypothetical protein
MLLIPSVSPGFGNLRSDRAGGTPELIRQGVHFFLGKSLGQFEDRG